MYIIFKKQHYIHTSIKADTEADTVALCDQALKCSHK